VRIKFEDAPAVAAKAFKAAITVKQSVVIDRNLGIGRINQMAIHPDLAWVGTMLRGGR
jgi:hypothetical protein